jgi:hypothetical protein
MHFGGFGFGFLRIGKTAYEHDIIIDRGKIRKRKKKLSKKFREEFGLTPLSVEEEIPWKCKRLVIGTGAYGRLPVMGEVTREAERRKVELLIVPTSQAIQLIEKDPLATDENTLLAFDPTSRIVPTTRTRISASITAYSAMSCPFSSVQSL